MSFSANQDHVVAVCVTYGERWHFLNKALRSAVDQGVSDIILVDNGTPYNAAARAEIEFPGLVESVRMERNTGSAGGFGAGLSRALGRQSHWILLLDDDNELAPDCLRALLDAPLPPDDARLALRPDHQKAILTAKNPAQFLPRQGAFLGFHYLEVPAKIMARLSHQDKRHPCGILTCPQAPYSGLLLPSRLLEAIGLPRKDFVLYSDDSEWSSRILVLGRTIYLVPTALIHDLDSSWHLAGSSRSSLTTWLNEGSDLRAYYACRNQIAFEQIRDGVHRMDRMINFLLYLCMLAVLSLFSCRTRRFALLLKAIRDGWTGRLGEHPGYRLT